MSNQRRITRLGLILISIIVVFIGFGWNAFADQEANKEDKRLENLIQWGQELVDMPLQVVVKWQGEWTNGGELSSLEAAQQLANLMELPAPQAVSNVDHETYRSITSIEGIRVTFSWQVISQEKSYLIVKMESMDTMNRSTLLRLQDMYRTQINLLDIDAAWNATVQGNVKERQTVTTTIKEVETKLHSHLKFSQVESYTDEMTISRSYEAPSLGFDLASGDHHMDMQIAVHLDEITGMSRVSLGFPIITIEY
ncbi:YwmB family TATA-box binding protein [Paenibacillus macquariensis]|uniref:TATA-box binding n=1 Tax=Paenibacillus macquariensis TaxID=948756 RepID=A0ABY1JQM9_9BACL|nr:YwmB family TATA-box binding protein [Paenibacillus macquariensis]MEC0092587.1 YwmB family TATA-box binding protein [Paenibacillus macquariensis]OAB36536.1 hypothetical protein PMSM_05880 [Paenibacillus macquariensis subsp. macquariensis]SIQ61739.1 TATA-box binding [Paenibacillus macquariensis]